MNWEKREKETHGKAITAQNFEIMSLKEQLDALVDGKGLTKDEVKIKIAKDFCECAGGERWFMELTMPMIMAALTN